MAIVPDELLRQTLTLGARHGEVHRLIVGLSGGLDSTVLLHALAAAEPDVPLEAVHVDHGLHPQSTAWAAQCEQLARTLGLHLARHRVRVRETGSGVEAAARDARYECFKSLLSAGDCLLLAHHLQDQSETVLLHLMRGSGARGVRGMPADRRLGAGRLLRPLLGTPRDDLEAYARRHDLDWIDDPSNMDRVHDRNFVRHDVLPLLRERWPAADDRLTHAAALAARSRDTIDRAGERRRGVSGTR